MRSLFLLLSAFAPLLAWSQTQPSDDRQLDLLGKGVLNVGINTGGGYSYNIGVTGRIMPRLQYFLANGWSVALEGRGEMVGNRSRYLGGGLSTRYYFVRDRRLALFGQLGATYGQYRSSLYRFDPTDPYSTYSGLLERADNALQVGLGLGVHYRVANRWSIEGMTERSHTNIIGYSMISAKWQLNLGVNFRLNR